MKILFRILVWGIGLQALAATSLRGQELKGGIRGQVTVAEIGGPVPGASVTVEGLGVSVEADRDGRFFIQGLEPGRYDLLVTKQGAGLLSLRVPGVAVTGGVATDVQPQMEADIVELDVRYGPVHAEQFEEHTDL